MKLPQLSYPIEREHTIPYLPHVFYSATLLLLFILITVNVALVGSDVVTLLRSDPITVEKPWWAPKFWPEALTPDPPDICQLQSISDDPIIRTNSSVPIFKYALRSANSLSGEESDDPSKRVYPTPYMANPLSNCTVQNILWRVDLPIRIMSYKVTIGCALAGQKEFGDVRIPDTIKLFTIHHRTFNSDVGPDDMKEYLSFNLAAGQNDGTQIQAKPVQSLTSLPADSSSSNNVVSVLDGLQTDLLHALWTQLILLEGRYRGTYLVEWVAGAGERCRTQRVPSDYSLIPCGDAADPNRIIRWYGNTNDWGSVNGTADFLRPFNASIINTFIGLQDAISIDLGSADTASNIFLNKTYFNQVIKPDPYHKDSEVIIRNTTGVQVPEFYWRFCSYWGCSDTSWAQTLRDVPEDVPLQNVVLPYKPHSQDPSVFNFSYLCPIFKRKAITSLLLSVFVATVSTMSAIYGLFCYVMPSVEKRYQKRQQAKRNKIVQDPEKQDHLLEQESNASNSCRTSFSNSERGMNKDIDSHSFSTMHPNPRRRTN